MTHSERMTINLKLDLEFEDVPTRLEQDEETGHYFVISDALNAFAGGETPAEAEKNFKDTLATLVASYLEAQEALPSVLHPRRQLVALAL